MGPRTKLKCGGGDWLATASGGSDGVWRRRVAMATVSGEWRRRYRLAVATASGDGEGPPRAEWDIAVWQPDKNGTDFRNKKQ